MITKEQCAAARAFLGGDWTQRRLAQAAGISEAAVRNFEWGRGVTPNESIEAIERALASAGVAIVSEVDSAEGVTLNLRDSGVLLVASEDGAGSGSFKNDPNKTATAARRENYGRRARGGGRRK